MSYEPYYRPRFYNTTFMDPRGLCSDSALPCARDGYGNNWISRDCEFVEPLGHDCGGAGFNFGTRFLRPATVPIGMRRSERGAEEMDEQTWKEKEREPTYETEWIDVNYPEVDWLKKKRHPKNLNRKIPRRRPLVTGAQVNGPFVVRMVPKAPCYHCETGPKAGGGIPSWRRYN